MYNITRKNAQKGVRIWWVILYGVFIFLSNVWTTSYLWSYRIYSVSIVADLNALPGYNDDL